MEKKSEIKIFGIKYKIKLIDSNSRIDNAMGSSDSKLGLITINKEMPIDIKFATLIHEIIEIIQAENDLNLKHNIISSISSGITDVLLHNDIYSYLKKLT